MEFERVIFRSKPGFNQHEDNGVSAFEEISESSFPGKCKVIYFYPKDFTFVCPTEIAGFNQLTQDFTDRDTILMGGSVDNEYVKLAWRRAHPDLNKLNHYQFGDTTGALLDQLGIREKNEADRKSTRRNSRHYCSSRQPSSASQQ